MNPQLKCRHGYKNMLLAVVILYLVIQLGLFCKAIPLPGISSKNYLEPCFGDYNHVIDPEATLSYANALDNKQIDGCLFRDEGIEKQSRWLNIERNQHDHVEHACNDDFPKGLVVFNSMSQLSRLKTYPCLF
jgi:hypothetical protein